MSELLHENSKGIKMIREDYKKRSQVKVFSEYQGKRHICRSYRFNRIMERFDSPYLSWANLDCCGGWSCDDEQYLTTAVQDGKKLYAGRTQSLRSTYTPNNPTREEAIQQFQEFVSTLPANVTADIEATFTEDTFDTDRWLHTFICRKGKIADFFDLSRVFNFYEKLDLHFSSTIKAQITDLCSVELSVFGGKEPPFLYYRAGSIAELVTTGLLLGYPIESTASILWGY